MLIKFAAVFDPASELFAKNKLYLRVLGGTKSGDIVHFNLP